VNQLQVIHRRAPQTIAHGQGRTRKDDDAAFDGIDAAVAADIAAPAGRGNIQRRAIGKAQPQARFRPLSMAKRLHRQHGITGAGRRGGNGRHTEARIRDSMPGE
jgi:hypothetical protein